MLKRLMVVGLISMVIFNMVGCGNTNQENVKEKAGQLVEEYK